MFLNSIETLTLSTQFYLILLKKSRCLFFLPFMSIISLSTPTRVLNKKYWTIKNLNVSHIKQDIFIKNFNMVL